MGISLENLDAIVLSHGHYDHTGGLAILLEHCADTEFSDFCAHVYGSRNYLWGFNQSFFFESFNYSPNFFDGLSHDDQLANYQSIFRMSEKQQPISIFGQRPENCIYLPDVPFSVRLNCKDGGIFIGGNEPKHRQTNPEDTIEISILKASKFYGDLGKTEGALWVQLFFIPAPSVSPELCKSHSLDKSNSQLSQSIHPRSHL